MNKTLKGILCVCATYITWGLFPLYWKLLDEVNTGEILLHRMVWSMLILTVFCIVIKANVLELIKNPKTFAYLSLCGLVISMNWGIYVYTINSGHVLEASLGYYINPLVMILIGTLMFKERLSKVQIIACTLAFIGVLIPLIAYGKIPWLALCICFTFSLYSSLKKKAGLPANEAMTVESIVVSICGLITLLVMSHYGIQSFGVGTAHSNALSITLLLIGAGFLTAIPMLLFNTATNLVPMSYMGFAQYITPTMVFFLGTFLYHEHLDMSRIICFCFIWVGILLMIGEAFITRKKSKFRRNY